jgi:hypothetical protein
MFLSRRLLPPLMIASFLLGPLPALAQTQAPPAPRRDWADRYLARLDIDKKGFITIADAERFATGQFDRLDANRDGIVDHDEFTASAKRSLDRAKPERKPAVQRALDRRETLFRTLDQHGDGKITKEEFLAATRAHFAEIDTGKTGKITLADLRTARHGL